MSRRIASLLAGLVRGATAPLPPRRRRRIRALASEALAETLTVETSAGPLYFSTPTARSMHDPEGLYTAEPETIDWLDGIPAGEVLWDIGANVGTYALYAAKVRGLRVVSFEPSAATYAVLVRNIELNGLSDRIDAYCLAFGDATALGHLNMAHTSAGHSMHAFGTAETVFGAIDPAFRQSVPGFAIDGFCDLFDPPRPQHVKLDVDGIEANILRGGERLFRAHVRSVMVEIAGHARETGEIARLLTAYGFREDAGSAAGRYNVLFRRA
jgi:FkbM family methyltransferase